MLTDVLSFFGTLVPVTLGLFLLLWRVWTFTVLPWLQPDEPEQIPYWIPCHALPFFKDSHELISQGVKYFGNTRKPFGITVVGKIYYVVTDPNDTSTFYNNTAGLSWDQFLNEVLIGFGVEPSRLDRLWAKAAVPTPVNPSAKSLINLTEDLYIQHLLPGKSFRRLASKLEWNMTKLMSWDELSNRFSLNVDGRGLSEAISLKNLCGDVLIDVTQMSLFDPVLFKLDPGMTKDMQFFTDELWKLLYPAPGISSTKVATLRARYTNTFLKYMKLPHNARKEEASLITTLVDQYKELDISEHDSAAMLVMVYWAGDANAYKLAFWMVAYILFDPALHALIREEVRPAVKPDGINMHVLVNNCPQLQSVFYEAMRLTKRDIGIRKVVRPTLLGGKLLSSGNAVILATCQLHENRDIFGHNIHEFDPNRFLKRPDLSRSPSFKPFGGGRTYCPGRVFAMQEIFSFIAFLFHRWDIELASTAGKDKTSDGKQTFPVADDSTITLGITRPLPGQDVWVKLAYNGSLA